MSVDGVVVGGLICSIVGNVVALWGMNRLKKENEREKREHDDEVATLRHDVEFARALSDAWQAGDVKRATKMLADEMLLQAKKSAPELAVLPTLEKIPTKS